MRKLTEKEFIEKSNSIHNNKYDYSITKYINNRNKVEIFCHEHGVFVQLSKNHLNGQGCPQCSFNKQLNTESFIFKAIKIHGNTYDYSLVKYENWSKPIEIICKKHGIFIQTPNSHSNGQGCSTCANNIKKTTEDFIFESKNRHGERYDYSMSYYKGANNKIDIVCSIHGLFSQRAVNHLRGEGCKGCSQSKGERQIELFLNSKKIKFIREKTFKDCRQKQLLFFDFYLPDFNVCIEYDGKQHFEQIPFFGGEKGFAKTIERDKTKLKFCKKNNIYLLRIPYYEKNLEKLITQQLWQD